MLPVFSNLPPRSHMIVDGFRGINTTPDYKSGELVSCSNMDSGIYPALGSRKLRTLCSQCDGTINGADSFNGYVYTYYKDEPKSIFLCYKGISYEFTSYTGSSDFTAKRQFAFLENTILIIPDNVMFFTDNLSFKKADIYLNTNQTAANSKFKTEARGSTAFNVSGQKGIGMVYHDRIVSNSVRYTYSSSSYTFYPAGLSQKLEVGDVVTIRISTFSPSATSTEQYAAVRRVNGRTYTAKIKDLAVVSHSTATNGTVTEITELHLGSNAINTENIYDLNLTSISIEKKLPALSYITSHGNRVWGVKGNMVYASKLGDADEWNDFSMDSYGTLPSSSFAASAGTDGDFTAIVPHGNYVYALKENHIHKIYGDTPDEYTISNLEAPGAMAGTHTLCVCGMYLMYASHDGICILRDGYPKVISRKLGPLRPICATAQGGRYYLLCHKNGKKVIYVYDLDHDRWTMETCPDDADHLCSDTSGVCFCHGGRMVYLTDEAGSEYEREVHWDFGIRFDPEEFKKHTSIRAIAGISLEANASFTARVKYDDGTLSAICGFCYDETNRGSAVLRLPLKRDLGFVIEFKGVGGFILRNIKFSYYKSSIE